MKRPSDQAKLLFLGLLRTVSALATQQTRVASLSSSYSQTAHNPPIILRFARRTDVPSIQRCNLATLPENYNQQFYSNHLRQWPELALVACVDERKSDVSPSFSPFPSEEPTGTVVAYVLGKVEERHVYAEDELMRDNFSPHHQYITTEKLGHVTSLAVLEPYRRQGLAQDLMKQLHLHLSGCYDVDAVGLHVRQSNTAAGRLYERFGYEQCERIPAYYQDGEDAYVMKKRLERMPMKQQNRLFGHWRRQRPWENGLIDWRLPRFVGHTVPQEEEEETSELLTGTM